MSRKKKELQIVQVGGSGRKSRPFDLESPFTEFRPISSALTKLAGRRHRARREEKYGKMKDVVARRWISFHRGESSFISTSIRTPSAEIFYFSPSFHIQLVRRSRSGDSRASSSYWLYPHAWTSVEMSTRQDPTRIPDTIHYYNPETRAALSSCECISSFADAPFSDASSLAIYSASVTSLSGKVVNRHATSP